MRYSKILIASLPFMLVGCLDVFDDSDDFYPQPVSVNASAPAATPVPPAQSSTPSFKPKPPKTSDCGCPEEGTTKPTAASPVAPCPCPTECSNPSGQPVDPDWHPKEGQIIQAGDLVMELQRSNGNVRPSHAAMCSYIQSKMGLTAPQAEVILEELGL